MGYYEDDKFFNLQESNYDIGAENDLEMFS